MSHPQSDSPEAIGKGAHGVAVFAGAGHFWDNHGPTLNDLLRRDGHKSVAISFTGADFNTEEERKQEAKIQNEGGESNPLVRSIIEINTAAQKLGLSQQEFAVKLQDRDQPQWMVHLKGTSLIPSSHPR
jgi:hypothetical protein